MRWSQVSISYWAALSWGKPFVKTISWKPEKKEKIGSPKHFVAKFPKQRESCRGGKELFWLLPTTPLPHYQHKPSTTKSEDFSFCCLSVCLHVSFCPFALCSFWLVVRTKHSTINKKKKHIHGDKHIVNPRLTTNSLVHPPPDYWLLLRQRYSCVKDTSHNMCLSLV